jgi:O-antigen/teichoic acid export membrane protein
LFSYIKKLSKNSTLYAIAEVSTKAIGFLLIPVYTRVLTPGDYGIIDLVTTMISVLIILFQVGLRAAVQRFYFEYCENRAALTSYVSTILSFVIVISITIVFAVGVGGRSLFEQLFQGVPFNPYVLMALGISFFRVFFLFSMTLFQVKEQVTKYAFLNIASFVVMILLIIFFVVYLRQGALGNVRALFISAMIFCIVSIYQLKDDYSFRQFDLNKLKKSLSFSIPLVPHMLSGWILTSVDRIFLNLYLGLSSVGLYSLGYKISNVMNVILFSINQAWIPFFMSTAEKGGEQAKDIFARLTTYYLAVVCFAALSISIPAQEIIQVITTADYHQAYQVVPIITFGWVLNGMYFMVVNQIFYVKKTKYLPLATFSSGIIQLLLNYLWIPSFGMVGSAWAMFTAQLWSFLITWFISFRVYPMHFEYKLIVRIFLVTAGLLVAGLLLRMPLIWTSLFMKGILLVSYPLFLLLVGIIKKNDLFTVRRFVVSKFREPLNS